jgi:hypothetical protein
MKKPIKDNQTGKCISTIYNGIDFHKWANQMEIKRLTSSKPDAEVKATLRRNRNCIP